VSEVAEAHSALTVVVSSDQIVDYLVSAATIATRTPDETARLHLAEVLGQMEACPWWAGPARSPGLNGRLPQRVLCPWSGVLTTTILRVS
jgi:hypothetical protein